MILLFSSIFRRCFPRILRLLFFTYSGKNSHFQSTPLLSNLAGSSKCTTFPKPAEEKEKKFSPHTAAAANAQWLDDASPQVGVRSGLLLLLLLFFLFSFTQQILFLPCSLHEGRRRRKEGGETFSGVAVGYGIRKRSNLSLAKITPILPRITLKYKKPVC